MNETHFLGKLRPIRVDELEIMLAWRNMPDVRKNMYNTHKISLGEHLKWWQKTQMDDSAQYFFYEYQGIACGVTCFKDIDSLSSQAMWGFYTSPNAPLGTGSRMELLMLDYAFNELNLHKLSCEVLDYNIAVVKLHKRFGFVEEEYFREHHFYQNQYVGVHRLAILADEWKQVRHNSLSRLAAFQNR